MDPLVLKENQVHQVMDVLLKEMYLGLNRDENKRKQTSLQMENTYVRTLLDGTGDPRIPNMEYIRKSPTIKVTLWCIITPLVKFDGSWLFGKPADRQVDRRMDKCYQMDNLPATLLF